jgi:diguanylate cyclase (GGDEF)-like protein
MLLCAALLVTATVARAADVEPFPALPPLERFAPDVEAGAANNGVAQDLDGWVYVANDKGVLVFDGEHWRLVPLPNGDIARIVADDGKGRVYVGGYDCFGYMERDVAGVARFIDLTPKFATLLKPGEHFAEIWDVYVFPEGVFFWGVQHVFRWHPANDAVHVWRREQRYGAMARDKDGEVLMQFRGEGLRKLVADDWVKVPGSERLSDLVYQFSPTPEGGLLASSRDGLWREWRGGKLRDYAMPAGMPPSASFWQYVALEDGRLAFASDFGEILLVDLRTKDLRRLKLDGSATNDLSRARDGGLLVTSDEAIYHVGWPGRWSGLSRNEGLASTTFGASRWRGRSFVLTGAGVYEVRLDRLGRVLVDQTLWTDAETYDLLELDPERALLADSYALRMVTPLGVRELTHRTFYPKLLRRSRFEADSVLVGTDYGLALFDIGPRTPALRVDPGEAFDVGVSSIAELSNTEVWIGTRRGGVQRITLSADRGKVEQQQAFGEADGLAYGTPRSASVAHLEGLGLIVTTAKGIWRWDGAKFAATDLEGLGALRDPESELKLLATRDGTVWAHGERELFVRPPGGAWRVEPTLGLRRGIFRNAHEDADGALLLVSSGSVLRFDPHELAPPAPPATVRLRAVRITDADGARFLPLDGSEIEIPQGQWSIRFEFTLTEYARPGEVAYQAKLLPTDALYDDWSPSAGFTYSNLPARDYEFQLSGRDPDGRITSIEPLRFTVTPPWYLSLWAFALYALVVAAGFLFGTTGFIRWRTARLAEITDRLERMVTVRTRELESANRQLETIAHVDGLTGIPNRRRLDDYLNSVWESNADRGRPLSVLIVDVDHFKKYNDQHGHLAGDTLLKALATRLSRCLRRTEDLVARYGGEEFIAVLPGADIEVAREVAETMRGRVEESTLGATISVGVATAIPAEGERLEALLGDADAALYAAKHAGRNCVKISQK